MELPEIIERLQRPADDFYPVPWWSWTGSLEFDEMRRQMQEMADQGIREFFIFPCYGLECPVFLGESWWKYVEFTLRECERLGMKAWIYDDLSWPSGSAGGLVLQAHPEYRMQLLQCRRLPLAPGETYRNDLAAKFVCGEFRTASGKTSRISLDKSFRWKNTFDESGVLVLVVTVFYEEISLDSTAVAWNRFQRGALDLLNPDAVKAWMGFIHEEYYRRFQADFGGTIKGFFCDEPRPNRCDGHSIPFTPALFKAFQKKYGYDLTPHLPKIFLNDEHCEGVRRDYWALITEMLADAFTRPLAEWCKQRKVILTGHAAPEEMCYQRNMLVSCGDIQQILQNMTMPGCDLLGAQTPFFDDQNAPWYGKGLKAMRNLVLTLKRPASTARLTSARRALCEAFGVRSWHGSLKEQKLINDCLAAMGINFINDNSLTYTISGFRRNLACKHITQPWWRHYRLFTEYSARLSAFAAMGALEAKVAVLFPSTSHACLTPADCGEPIPPKGDFAEAVNATGDALLKSHIDFEFLFESAFEEAEVADGALKIPDGEISILILPQACLVSEKTLAKLQDFLDAGGAVICVGARPDRVIAPTGELREFPHDARIIFLPLDDVDFPSRLTAEINCLEPPSWSIEGAESEKVVTCMRGCEGVHLLLVANQLPGARTLRLRHVLGQSTEILDLEGGKLFQPQAEISDNIAKIDFDLAEDQSLLFLIGKTSEPAPPFEQSPLGRPQRNARLELGGDWDFSLEGQNLLLPECELRADPFNVGEQENWHSVDSPLWRPVVHGKYAMGLSPEETPFYWLRCKFELQALPPDLSLVVDNGDCETVYLNGRQVSDWKKTCLWDSGNRIYRLAEAARLGMNELCLKARVSQWFSPTSGLTGYYEFRNLDKYPLLFVLRGMFGVVNGAIVELPRSIRNGSWTRQGFPFFAGTGCYRQSFAIDEMPDKPLLAISDVAGVVEVELNGVILGAKAWGPLRFDIKNAIKKGENMLVIKVAGSLGNILQHSYGECWTPPRDYGLTGDVSILWECT